MGDIRDMAGWEDRMAKKPEYRTCENCGQTRNYDDAKECPRCRYGASKYRSRKHPPKEE